MVWAIEQQEITEPSTRHVLLCLANYAGADGSAAFPSVLRLARDTGFSERAVQTHLRKLEKAMLIRQGNSAYASLKISRADRMPKVYDLLISRGAPDSPRGLTGCTGERHGVQISASRGAPRAPDPFLTVKEQDFEDDLKNRPEEIKKKAEEARAQIRSLAKRLRSQ